MTGHVRRVVVTGIGAVCSVGLSVPDIWAALTAGRSGIGLVDGIETGDLPVRIGAQIRDFDGDARFGRRRARHLDRVVQLALTATDEAVSRSGVDIRADPERVGVVFGTGIGGISSLEEGTRTLAERGAEWVNPYVLPMLIPNMAAGQIAIEHGILGYSSCTVTACSASANAIGDGLDLIRAGRADVVVCGGSEAGITRLGMAGFAAMKALSTRNDDPEAASRPFDAERDGFVMGEGAGALVIEERDRAIARDAPILAELVGYGATSDAYHITSPHPQGDGAVRAMQGACSDGGVDPGDVGYINAHGTSTVPNDRVETHAVRRIWGDDAPPMSSTKSMTGHTLGAAGAIESIVCILALRDGLLPPTINQERADPECDLDYVPNKAREAVLDLAMSNSFGFGGHNSALLWRRG